MQSEKGLLNLRLQWKSMFRYILGHKEESEGSGTLKKKDQLKEEKELSKLLSFETIKAKTFYHIQKEMSEVQKMQENLPNQNPENLNENLEKILQRWQKAISLLKKEKVSDELANEAWNNILSRHYEYVDEDSFNIFVKGFKKDVKWDCELAEMKSALALAKLGMESGWDGLKEIGLTGTITEIEQKIRGRITNHELKQKPSGAEDSKPIDFYVMMAQIRKRDYKVNSNTLLIEWDGILKSIREENERSN